MLIRVIGAGIAGLTTARAFAERGVSVEIVEKGERAGRGCSFYAGGMIAPWCEKESAEPLVVELGKEALAYWTSVVPIATTMGSIVVAPPRDRAELLRFARMTSHFEEVDSARLGAIEPDLADRFSTALYFAEEAHLDPREAVKALVADLTPRDNVAFRYGEEASTDASDADWTVDCRGFAARDRLSDLRGVKGEMIILRTRDITLSRPVRMLHPRHPVYIVPRENNLFMVGATMIENEERSRVTARSVVELVNSAFAIHPAFGEAEIVEMGSDVRPAFPDNLPRIRRDGRTLFVNGLFRHGFLLSPALARRVACVALDDAFFPEVMDADPRERKSA